LKYSLHVSTAPTLLTWAFGPHGVVKEWRAGWPIPEEIKNVARNPQLYNIIAHNVFFDYCIWVNCFFKLMPDVKCVAPAVENLTDSMALTNHFGAGSALDDAAKVLNMPDTKDKRGRELMLKQCKPNAKGHFVELTPSEWDEFAHYGKTDTRLMRDIYY